MRIASIFATLAPLLFLSPAAAQQRVSVTIPESPSGSSSGRLSVDLPLFLADDESSARKKNLNPLRPRTQLFTFASRLNTPSISTFLHQNLSASQTSSSTVPPTPPDAPPPIADNSFLIEEAYNQEYGVVQHISAFRRDHRSGNWEYTFTQEWPIQPAPRHQFSYTIPLIHLRDFPASQTGVGDILLNWRYQVLGKDDSPVWFSPRFSFVLPTGDSRFARGAGALGYQVNLPVSARIHRKLVTHWNAGFTVTPNAKNELGDRATTHEYFLGNSLIWLLHPRFNAMLETVFVSSQSVIGPADAQWSNTVTINPGFRWAHNLSSGLQIVPGIAFPVEVGRQNRGDWGIFLYLSFEHAFKKGLK